MEGVSSLHFANKESIKTIAKNFYGKLEKINDERKYVKYAAKIGKRRKRWSAVKKFKYDEQRRSCAKQIKWTVDQRQKYQS